MLVHTKETLVIEGNFFDIININWLMQNGLLSNQEFATAESRLYNNDSVNRIEISQCFCIIVKTNCTLIQILKASLQERMIRLFKDILSCLSVKINSICCGIIVENFCPCDVQRFKDSISFPYKNDMGVCYAIKIRLDNPLIPNGESFETMEIVYVVKDNDESTRSDALKMESFSRIYCSSLENILQFSNEIKNYIERAEEVNIKYLKNFVNEE